MQRIKLVVDLNDGNPPQHLVVDATDRREVVVDEYGVTARSDGQKLDSAEKAASIDLPSNVVFNNQLDLFDSKPWQMKNVQQGR